MPVLDPAYDYVVADSLVFTNDFGSPPTAPVRVVPTAVAGAAPTEVSVTIPAHNPSDAVPELAFMFYIPYPVPVSPITLEWLFDDANAFPFASAPLPIPDHGLETVIPIAYAGPQIYDQCGCQLVYAFRR